MFLRGVMITKFILKMWYNQNFCFAKVQGSKNANSTVHEMTEIMRLILHLCVLKENI